MIIIGVIVANRCDSMIACIKKVFGDVSRCYFISDAAKHESVTEHIFAIKNSGKEICFICASNDDIVSELFSGVFFDVVIYDNMAGEDLQVKNIAKSIHPKTIVISNGDDKIIPEFMHGMKLCAVTYGLGQKCSITPSCIDTSDGMHFNCCIQRNIPSLNGGDIEIGENTIYIDGASINIYDALAAASVHAVTKA